jgi:Neuraminidase (sialidase)
VSVNDGRLFAVFYAGYTHVSAPCENLPKGGRISGCFSSDEGKTWTPAQTIYDGPDDDRDPSIVQLSDGRILCDFFSLQKKDGCETPLGSWMIESKDGGATWSEAQCIAPSDTHYLCSSPIRELPDKTLILGLYWESWKPKDDANGAVAISKDMGKTWSAPINIDNGGQKLDAETDVIRLKDGRLYAAQRSEKESMCYSISEDNGQTWSVSKQMGFRGHCPYLYRVAGDIILCGHRVPYTSLRYSLDEGKTWSDGGVVDKVDGAYPSMVLLKDGNVLIVYYEEGEGSNIRAKKFRIDKNGITWLAW